MSGKLPLVSQKEPEHQAVAPINQPRASASIIKQNTEAPTSNLLTPQAKAGIPEELLCFACKDLLEDAVLIPCCANSFCDKCVRQVISDNHKCPACFETDVSPNHLLPSLHIRKAVLTFKNETGYTRMKKDTVVASPHVQVQKEKLPEASPSTTVENQQKIQVIKNETGYTQRKKDTVMESPHVQAHNEKLPEASPSTTIENQQKIEVIISVRKPKPLRARNEIDQYPFFPEEMYLYGITPRNEIVQSPFFPEEMYLYGITPSNKTVQSPFFPEKMYETAPLEASVSVPTQVICPKPTSYEKDDKREDAFEREIEEGHRIAPRDRDSCSSKSWTSSPTRRSSIYDRVTGRYTESSRSRSRFINEHGIRRSRDSRERIPSPRRRTDRFSPNNYGNELERSEQYFDRYSPPHSETSYQPRYDQQTRIGHKEETNDDNSFRKEEPNEIEDIDSEKVKMRKDKHKKHVDKCSAAEKSTKKVKSDAHIKDKKEKNEKSKFNDILSNEPEAKGKKSIPSSSPLTDTKKVNSAFTENKVSERSETACSDTTTDTLDICISEEDFPSLPSESKPGSDELEYTEVESFHDKINSDGEAGERGKSCLRVNMSPSNRKKREIKNEETSERLTDPKPGVTKTREMRSVVYRICESKRKKRKRSNYSSEPEERRIVALSSGEISDRGTDVSGRNQECYDRRDTPPRCKDVKKRALSRDTSCRYSNNSRSRRERNLRYESLWDQKRYCNRHNVKNRDSPGRSY